MKIMAQDRQHMYDITGADIYIDSDTEWYHVILAKGRCKYSLGHYYRHSTAEKELKEILWHLDRNKTVYEMSY